MGRCQTGRTTGGGRCPQGWREPQGKRLGARVLAKALGDWAALSRIASGRG